MTQQPVVGIGEVLWDLFPESRVLGGGTANFAYHLAQFGFNSRVVSAVGFDRDGDQIVDALTERGVAFDLQRVGYPTGTVVVQLEGAGIPRYEIREGVAWDHLAYNQELDVLAAECCAVCFGSLAQRTEQSRQTILRFLERMPEESLRIFDVNLRQHFFDEQTLLGSLRRCNIVKLNEEELAVLGAMFGYEGRNPRAVCRAMVKDYALQALILTCGKEGSYIFTPDESSYYDTPKVEVADTVGAGDSFTGAFCAALLAGRSVRGAHRLAVEVAAYVCTQNGGMPPMPPRFTHRLDEVPTFDREVFVPGKE